MVQGCRRISGGSTPRLLRCARNNSFEIVIARTAGRRSNLDGLFRGYLPRSGRPCGSLPEWVGVGAGSIAPIKRCAWQATLAVGGCVGENRSGAGRIVSQDLRDTGKARLVWRHAAQCGHGLNPDEQDDANNASPRPRKYRAVSVMIPTLLLRACFTLSRMPTPICFMEHLGVIRDLRILLETDRSLAQRNTSPTPRAACGYSSLLMSSFRTYRRRSIDDIDRPAPERLLPNISSGYWPGGAGNNRSSARPIFSRGFN